MMAFASVSGSNLVEIIQGFLDDIKLLSGQAEMHDCKSRDLHSIYRMSSIVSLVSECKTDRDLKCLLEKRLVNHLRAALELMVQVRASFSSVVIS